MIEPQEYRDRVVKQLDMVAWLLNKIIQRLDVLCEQPRKPEVRK